MAIRVDEIITDPYILREGHVFREGFVFTEGQSCPVVYNRLLIRVPEFAQNDMKKTGYSTRTLEEHVELVNKYQIEKVMIICDDLNFILNCPSIKDIVVYPSYGAAPSFDYSPLYKLPNLKCVDCKTIYGPCEQYKTTVDYTRIKKLEDITMVGEGHIKFETVSTLKEIWLSGNKKIRSFSDVSCSPELQKVTLYQCGIQSLKGIERHERLETLILYGNRTLTDISELENVAETLKTLVIENCSKITDFTVLHTLRNLEHLQLYGNNVLPDLKFLSEMKKLKTFTFTMNIENGELSNCLKVPYVSCKNRKHYNLKDIDLPKGRVQRKIQ